MRKNFRYPIQILLGLVLVSYFLYDLNQSSHLSFEQAGTDFTQAFNEERKKMKLPIIPSHWKPKNPLTYKIQTWENPDTILPCHSEKLVVASSKAEFLREVDYYTLYNIGDTYYQIVIEFSKMDSLWTCTLKEAYPPADSGLRYAGLVLHELTLAQASDTLQKYGIKRLNY